MRSYINLLQYSTINLDNLGWVSSRGLNRISLVIHPDNWKEKSAAWHGAERS